MEVPGLEDREVKNLHLKTRSTPMSTTTSITKPISPLRRRMIEDMTVRGFGEKTQGDYIRHVKNFSTFLGRSPDTAGGEDLRAFQVRQREHSPCASSPFFLASITPASACAMMPLRWASRPRR